MDESTIEQHNIILIRIPFLLHPSVKEFPPNYFSDESMYFNDERMIDLIIDSIDMEIIRCLQRNSRMQWKQIGQHVHMSGVAVANRIQRLEEIGVIEGYTVRLNEKLLGNIYCIFIIVKMKDYRHKKFQEFIQERDEIKEAHRVSGEPCFILKAQVPDQDQLSKLLDEILVYGHYKINISIGQFK